jgi:hypothetical protein
MLHEGINPTHWIWSTGELVFRAQDEQKAVSGIREPAFLHQAGDSRSQGARLQMERGRCLLASKIGAPASELVIDEFIERSHSQIICDNRQKYEFFAYDLGKGGASYAGTAAQCLADTASTLLCNHAADHRSARPGHNSCTTGTTSRLSKVDNSNPPVEFGQSRAVLAAGGDAGAVLEKRLKGICETVLQRALDADWPFTTTCLKSGQTRSH